jgi:serine/threonine protein kinase
MSSFYAGSVLEDRFELVSSLGEGGASTVWLAHDLRLGISVAVKVLRTALRAESDKLRAFELEAELCSRMRSPHIVRVLSHGVDANGLPYIVYELLDGETLATRISCDKKLGLDETESIIVHVARALARAHSMGVVHKDIKPANVFIAKDDQGRDIAKVLDFGIAEVVDRTRGPSEEICGTLEYMPPEVLRDGAAADARADLYALAAVTYECLSGTEPYTGESILDVLSAMNVTPPSLAPALGAAAAQPLDAWVRRGLDPDPARRFQSARELAEDLHAAIKKAKRLIGPLASVERRSGHRGFLRVATPTAWRPSPPSDAEVPESRRSMNPSAPKMRAPMPSFTFEEDGPSQSGAMPIAEENALPSRRDARRE